MRPRPSLLARRRRVGVAVASVTAAAGLGTAVAPDVAGAVPKNLISAYATVEHGCTNRGFRLSTTSPEGFFLGYGTHGGACSISGPWGVPVLFGAQGRLTYTAPTGSRIARWNLHLEAHGAGAPPVSTEIYVNDEGGEYQAHDFGTATYNGQVETRPNHPDGARSMFFLMRSHQHHTQSNGWFRHANIHNGSVDLYDLERPAVSGVSVDGGSDWSASAHRTVRWTGADNLGNTGIERYRVTAGSTVLHDSGTAGGTTGTKSAAIDVGALGDGSHAITIVAEANGSGDLGQTTSNRTIRLDRTSPTLAAQRPLPASIVGDFTIALNAADAHAGIRDVSIERAVAGGWKEVHRTTRDFAAIVVDSLQLPEGENRLRAVATDTAGNTRTLEIGSIAVRNSPRRTGAPTHLVELPAVVKPGQILRAAPGNWTGAAPINTAYQWQMGVAGTWANIPGANGVAYTVQPGDVGKRLRLKLTIDNPAPGSVVEFSHESKPVQPLAGGGQVPPVVAKPGTNGGSGGTKRIVVPPPPTTGPQPGAGARLVLAGAEELRSANARKKGIALRPRRAVPIFIVRYPRPAAISVAGRFLQADGAPIPGHPIALVEAGVVRDWARTDASGRVSFSYRPRRSGAIRLRWGGSRGHDPIHATAAAKVIGRLGVAAPRRARAGRALIVRGRTVPGVRKELLVLERLNTTRCPAWRQVAVDGRQLSIPRRTIRQASSAPPRCWETAGKARTRNRGAFTVRERKLLPLRLAGGTSPTTWSYAAYLRVRGLNSVSDPVRVIVRG